MGKLDGKVVLITGASKGLGEETARQMIAEGAKVMLSDITDDGQKVADELGDHAGFVTLDVSNQADWAKAVEVTEEKFGPLNVLVNNAGVGIYKPIEDLTEEDLNKTFKVDVNGVFLGMKAVIPTMKEQGGGSIVNISSVSGLRGAPTGVAYCGAKFAVTGMTKAAACDLGQYNIRVNSVHPGTFMTDLATQEDVGDYVKSLEDAILLGRIAQPKEIAKAVLFLASDDSSYCSGAEYTVDGGLTASL